MYPGHGEVRARRRLRRDRRLVRDAGEGRALARQPLPEGAGLAGRLRRIRGAAVAGETDAQHSGKPAASMPPPNCLLRQTDVRSSCSEPDTVTHDDARRQPRGADAPSDRLAQSRVLRRRCARSRSMERVFDICHGCRRCVSLCSAFPTLFDLVDESKTMEVDGVRQGRLLARSSTSAISCDVCYMTKCPYVPPHPWNVDFPHLMLRGKAVRVRNGRRSFPRHAS